jgi:integrase
MLERGVPIDQVSPMLGDASAKTTEKYYAPWARSRQRLLDEAVATLNFVRTQSIENRMKRVK